MIDIAFATGADRHTGDHFQHAAVRISLKLCDGSARETVVVMFGFTNVQLPRLEPWGPSSSINNARITAVAPSTVNLSLELQSGDVLRVDAKSIDLLSPEKNGNVDPLDVSR